MYKYQWTLVAIPNCTPGTDRCYMPSVKLVLDASGVVPLTSLAGNLLLDSPPAY